MRFEPGRAENFQMCTCMVMTGGHPDSRSCTLHGPYRIGATINVTLPQRFVHVVPVLDDESDYKLTPDGFVPTQRR